MNPKSKDPLRSGSRSVFSRRSVLPFSPFRPLADVEQRQRYRDHNQDAFRSVDSVHFRLPRSENSGFYRNRLHGLDFMQKSETEENGTEDHTEGRHPVVRSSDRGGVAEYRSEDLEEHSKRQSAEDLEPLVTRKMLLQSDEQHTDESDHLENCDC